MRTHRAACQTAIGGPEFLEIIDRPVPEPGGGEVRVRVVAAGLNPVDWKVAASEQLSARFGVPVPGGYGNDLAGVIDAVGADVEGFAVGDRVVGEARGAAVADDAVVRARTLVPVPDGVSLAAASTLPIAARTADAAIRHLNLTAEDTVLIGGAAGGVGLLAVQFARATGATVIATASASNHDVLRDLGALPVDYHGDLVKNIRAVTDRPVTAATDLQGVTTLTAALELGVAPERITTIAASDVPNGVRATGGNESAPGTVARALAEIAEGRLTVEITGVYPLEQLPDAVARLSEGHVRGKLVIQLSQDDPVPSATDTARTIEG
ncbi:NADP-dependent oxidoreductase [Microbacterium gorillae]|uniref:NADP-dependent oxidoreductase n=1 Tax=Microbacterium gorillae TaxID=1231063 RepID=UPI000694B1A5|nr:NADP-dependent oxidoreductase [Microbacterium gorillae]